MRTRRQRAAISLATIAVATVIVVATVAWIRHSGSAVRPEGLRLTGTGSPATEPTPRLAAPDERHGIDDGVAGAARQFAVQFVTPKLKFPESAAFPERTIRLERFPLMNYSTGNRIEHWYVDGGVDSLNEYGVIVRSWWRIMIGRVDDKFFPVVVSLEGRPIYQMRGHVDMLQDARRANQQQQESEAAAMKAKELSTKRMEWQAAASAKPADQKAQEALKLAIDLLEAGRHEPAHRRLREVIEKFPGTDAAAEAEKLLNK